MKQEKHTLPNRQSQAYTILSIIAVSGELPTKQISRLPGGREYKNKLIKNLKHKNLINTYYKDKLRGHKLTTTGKTILLENNPERFEIFLTGNTETNQPKYEITRRLRIPKNRVTAVLCCFSTNRQAGSTL